jgi:hypothetical protein
VLVRPLEIPNEDLFELRLDLEAVGQQEFEPRLNEFPDTDVEVLDDEIIIVRSSGSEPEDFQPYTRVCLPSVLGDVGGRSEARREWCFLDLMTEGLRAWVVWTGAPVSVPIARSAAMPGGCLLVLPFGLVVISCIRGHQVDVGAAAGPLPRVNDVARVVVGSQPATH